MYIGGPSEFITGRVLPALAPLIVAGVRMRVTVGDDALVLTGDRGTRARPGGADAPGRPSRHLERAARARGVRAGRALRTWRWSWGPYAAGKRGARAIEHVPLLAYAEELPLIRGYWQDVFGVEPNVLAAVVADSLPALAALAERGLGITVLPRHVCEEQLGSGRLVRLVEPKVPPTSDLYLAWGAGSRRTAAVAAAFDRIHEVVGATA